MYSISYYNMYMARYTKEEKAMMLYALTFMKGESDCWNDQTHKKLKNLIYKVETPLCNGTQFYDKSFGEYIKSWSSEDIELI